MTEKTELLVHLIVSLVRLIKPGGMKVVRAETMIMKQQQLIVMNRGRARAPKLGTSDRFRFGLLAHFIPRWVMDALPCKYTRLLVKNRARKLFRSTIIDGKSTVEVYTNFRWRLEINIWHRTGRQFEELVENGPRNNQQ